MHTWLAALLALAAVAPAEAQVRVHVDIGIHLPAPPRLVVVPAVPAVQYVPAPAAPSNLFFYGNQYWAFASGGWYVSGGYNGQWVVVAPQFVPRPVLLVPVVLSRTARTLEELGARPSAALAGRLGARVGRQARVEITRARPGRPRP